MATLYFDWKNEKPFPITKSIHISLLKLSCYKRNINVVEWTSTSGTRWHAIGSAKTVRFRRNMPYITSESTRKITDDKNKTKIILNKHNIRTPSGILFNKNELDKFKSWYHDNNFNKVVIKPLSGSGGNGVYTELKSIEECLSSISKITSNIIIAEEHVDGSEHRLLVIDGKFIAAIKRHPCHIIGDGKASIGELIDIKNKDRSQNPYTRDYLINKDPKILSILEKNNKNIDSILENGQFLQLETVSNIGMGGDSEDITDIVHEDYKTIAQKCFNSFEDMYFCGIDLITNDITAPIINDKQYAVIEINANCDLAMHHFPTITKSKPLNVCDYYISNLFPEDDIAPTIARKLSINGKVQNVGYRNFIENTAYILGINGWCKNEDDGSVSAHIEGSEVSISKLMESLSIGTEKSTVFKIDITPEDVKNFDNFKIYK